MIVTLVIACTHRPDAHPADPQPTAADSGPSAPDSATPPTGEPPLATLDVLGLQTAGGRWVVGAGWFLRDSAAGVEVYDPAEGLPVDGCVLTPPPTDGTADTGFVADPTLDGGEVEVTLDGAPIGWMQDWVDGATIGLSATGSDEFPAFDLPDAMQLPEHPVGTVTPQPDGSLAIEWVPATRPGTDLVLVVLSRAGALSCLLTDDGAFDLTAEQLGDRPLAVALDRSARLVERQADGVKVWASGYVQTQLYP